MGVIAEELPELLQLKKDPPFPDWPSIYGSFWASIKALHERLEALREKSLSSLHFLKTQFISLKEKQETWTHQLLPSQSKLATLKAELGTTKRELHHQKRQVDQIYKNLEDRKKELTEMKKTFHESLTKVMKRLSIHHASNPHTKEAYP